MAGIPSSMCILRAHWLTLEGCNHWWLLSFVYWCGRKYFIYHQVRSHSREGNGTPLQYSCLENPMDGVAWKAAVHGVAEGRTWLSDFTFTIHFHTLEKEMATHSSVLAWRIPATGEPNGLPSMALHRVRHDWSDLSSSSSREGNGKSLHYSGHGLGKLWLLRYTYCLTHRN